MLYHEYHKGRRPPLDCPNKQNGESNSGQVLEKKKGADGEEEPDYSAAKVDGSTIGVEELTLDILLVRLFLFFAWISYHTLLT